MIDRKSFGCDEWRRRRETAETPFATTEISLPASVRLRSQSYRARSNREQFAD